MDTLAAAYAEAGKFAEAVVEIKKALALTSAPEWEKRTAELKARLLLYENSTPFRELPCDAHGVCRIRARSMNHSRTKSSRATRGNPHHRQQSRSFAGPPAVVGALLTLATLAVFWPVVHCDFVSLDDPDYG